VIFILSIALGLFGNLPSFRDLENPKSNLASEIISSDGEVLGTYFVQNRSNVNFRQLSPHLVNALIATEDVRFYDHSGIDFRRSFTILYHNLQGRKQGASTITQQLAKNMFPRSEMKSFFSILIVKLKEWIMAVMLERYYTKEEIITMYFNTVDFGNNAFGIKAAARIYFNSSPAKLNPVQSALLVGMLKGPSMYSPVRNPERALSRRNIVLSNMQKEGFLDESETEQFQKKNLGLDFHPVSYGEGSAAYFRAVLKKDLQRILKEHSIEKADGITYDLDRDGLKIFTTINSKMQDYAEEAQREYLKELQKQFNQQWRGRDPFGGSGDLITLGLKRSERYKQLKEEGLKNEEIWANFRKKTPMKIFSWRGEIDTIMRPIDSIKYYKMLLRNAMMSMEPQTGNIRAWVGGIDFNYFKYDQVKMGTRQVGSIAKPFTYAVAIRNGYSPCFQVLNQPVVLETADGKEYIPKQDKPLQGYLTLKKALAYSQNYVAAYVMSWTNCSIHLDQKNGGYFKSTCIPINFHWFLRSLFV
jgi:penicillin-binding protein 1A